MNVYFQTLFFLVLPTLILFLRVVPFNQRGLVLAITILGIIASVIIDKIPLKEVGIRLDNLKKSLGPYSLFTIVGLLSLVALSILLHQQPLDHWWTYNHLRWAFLPISAAQEFGYRAYFQTKLQKVSNPYAAIVIITTLYSGMHILWGDPLILAMTFIGGMGWGYLWYKYPNLYLLILSHAILNFLAIYLGFFPY